MFCIHRFKQMTNGYQTEFSVKWQSVSVRFPIHGHIFWTWCSWFITSLNITPMFLADSVGTTLTTTILMSHIGGRGRCLACITKKLSLIAIELKLITCCPCIDLFRIGLHFQQSSRFFIRPWLKWQINLAIISVQLELKAMFSNYVTKGGRI